MVEGHGENTLSEMVDLARHPLQSDGYRTVCAKELERTGVLVLKRFLLDETVRSVIDEFTGREEQAFYASTTHNVWLTPPDATHSGSHVFNRQIASSKGLLADDEIDDTSALKQVYADPGFRSFVAATVGVPELFPYADPMSSVNMHFHRDGEELGWHFDNSSFAVTTLIQAPEAGGVFEYVPGLRNADAGDQNFDGVERVLDAQTPPRRLDFGPGDLVIFRGRDALHRVTPSTGSTTRMLVVFAFNEEPAISLSDSAMQTFYGRTANGRAGLPT